MSIDKIKIINPDGSEIITSIAHKDKFVIQKTDSVGTLVLDGESINVKETTVVDNIGNEKILPAKTIATPTDEGIFLVLYNDSKENYDCLYDSAIVTVVTDTPPILTADGVPYTDIYAVSSSSKQASGYQPYLATNGTSTSKTDCWSSGSPLLSEGSPIYFNMYFKDPTRVGRIDFINRASGGDNPSPPTEFTLQGSKTNVVGEEEWVDIQDYTNTNTEFSGEWSIFISVSKRDHYYGYRLKITDSASGDYVDIASITPGTTTEEYVNDAVAIQINQETKNYAVFKPDETDGTYVQIPEYTTPPLGFGVVNTKLELYSFGVGSTTYKYPKSDIKYILINDTEEQSSTGEIPTNIVATNEEYLEGTSETKVPNVKQISDDLHTIGEAMYVSLPDSVTYTAPILTSNGTPYVDEYAVSASSDYQVHQAWMAANQTNSSLTDCWIHTATYNEEDPVYYNMFFNSRFKLQKIDFQNRGPSYPGAPSQFTLQGSKTNVVGEEVWIDIQRYTNTNNTASASWSIEVNVANQDWYRAYRLKLTKSLSSTYANMAIITPSGKEELRNVEVKDLSLENYEDIKNITATTVSLSESLSRSSAFTIIETPTDADGFTNTVEATSPTELSVKASTMTDRDGNIIELPIGTINSTVPGTFNLIYSETNEVYELVSTEDTIVENYSPPTISSDGIPYIDEYAVGTSTPIHASYPPNKFTNGTANGLTDAFIGILSSGTVSVENPIYIYFYFKNAYKINKIDFINRDTSVDIQAQIVNFTLQGTKDKGTTWTDIQSYNNTSTGQKQAWAIDIESNNQDYYYGYRLKVVSVLHSANSAVAMGAITPTGDLKFEKISITSDTNVTIPPLALVTNTGTALDVVNYDKGSSLQYLTNSDEKLLDILTSKNTTSNQPATDEEYTEGIITTKSPSVKQVANDLYIIGAGSELTDELWKQPVLTANGTMYVDEMAVSANNEYDATYMAWKAVNGAQITASCWLTLPTAPTPRCYNIGFLTPKKISEFSITNRIVDNDRNTLASPKTFTLQGSKTNVVGEEVWIDIQSYTNNNNDSGGVWSIKIDEINQDYYYGYRLKIDQSNDNGVGTFTNIGQIKLVMYHKTAKMKVKDLALRNSDDIKNINKEIQPIKELQRDVALQDRKLTDLRQMSQTTKTKLLNNEISDIGTYPLTDDANNYDLLYTTIKRYPDFGIGSDLTSSTELLAPSFIPSLVEGVTGYTVTQSSYFNDTRLGINAFIRSGAYWTSKGLATPPWVAIKLPEPLRINLLVVYVITASHRATSISIQGSNDGATWTNLATVTNSSGFTDTIIIKLPEYVEYSHYKYIQNSAHPDALNAYLYYLSLYDSELLDYWYTDYISLNSGVYNNEAQLSFDSNNVDVSVLAENKYVSSIEGLKFGTFVTIPVGSIVEWEIETLPIGWLWCDGTTTPDEYTELKTLLPVLPDKPGKIILASHNTITL